MECKKKISSHFFNRGASLSSNASECAKATECMNLNEEEFGANIATKKRCLLQASLQ